MVDERATIDHRLALEHGVLRAQGRRSIALVYPSPYPIGMASLGFQTIYRALNHLGDTHAERAFASDADGPVLTYESGRAASDFPVVAFSVAYETEIVGLVATLTRMGVPVLGAERTAKDPFVVVGGPLTFSNPLPLAPFADVIVMGEAEQLLAPLIDVLFAGRDRARQHESLAAMPGFFVPSVHGEQLPAVVACAAEQLPAYSAIWTREAALGAMFLIEPERGCSRGCTFCVMRRTTCNGMRLVPVDRVLARIPVGVPRVGLVGAAVSDHPAIVELIDAIVERGCQVGVSSLRADRLTPALVAALVRGGYTTLTTAADGASQRLRGELDKNIDERHLLHAAELCREAGLKRLKIYVMVGVPGENDDDLRELVDCLLKQALLLGPGGRLALSVAPFVAKRNTPLAGTPFVGIREVDRRVALLRSGAKGRIDVRATSSRWAWVEDQLARGGPPAGLAAFEAWKNGASFAAFRRAFKGM